MKILLLHNKYQFRGGEDLVFESEEKLLKANGHEVDTLIFNNGDIKTLKQKLKVILGCIYNFESGKVLKKKILEFKPNIIHVHNFFLIASPSIFFIAKKFHIPIILTLHNYRLICPSATLYFDNKIYENSLNKIFPIDAVIKGVYRNSKMETAMIALITGFHKLINSWNTKVTYYIALTDFARNKFLNSSLRVDPSKIVIKPNFVEDFGFKINDRENYFLFIGRLSEEKGILKILEIAPELPEVEFRIIGDGPLKLEVQQAAEKNQNVVYLGFRDKDFIIDQLKNSKALIFPSLWYEGFPMTILEAFSCGTPVLASALGGPKEIIKNEFNGLLFDHLNSEHLLNCISEIQNDSDLHLKMCQNARNTYEKYYTPEKNFKLLMGIYEKALKSLF